MNKNELAMNFRLIKDNEKASLTYIVANILSKGVYFLTIPIFTRLLSTSEMGVTTTFSSWQTILYAVMSLGLVSGSFNVAMITYEKQRDQYMTNSLLLTSISAFVFLIFATLFGDRWEMLTGLPPSTMWIMSIYLFLQPAMDFWYARQRYENKYKAVFWVSVISTLSSTMISVLAVKIISEINGIYNLGMVKIAAQFIVIFIFSLFFYIKIFQKGKIIFDKRMIRFSLCLSIPLVIHSLSKNILDISDRIMIANMCGQSKAGIYGIVYTISLMGLIVWNAINSAFVPEMFKNLNELKYVQTEEKIYKLIKAFGEISVVAVLFSPELIHILTTEEYYDAVILFPPLFASVFLTSIYNIYGNFLLYKKCTLYIMYATLIATIINIVSNYILIQILGYMVAAYTTLLATIVLVIGQGVMQKYTYEDEVINHKKIALYGIIGTMACLFSGLIFEMGILRYTIIIFIVIVASNDIKRILLKN